MKIIETAIAEVSIFEPTVLSDDRGFFTELYQSERYAAVGIYGPFLQDNLSRSERNVLRGLHLQNPTPQGKLVTVLSGCVLDVVVDMRVGSPSFGQHVKTELSETNRRQFWVPRGFAHGFRVLSKSADFFYKCDAVYNPCAEITVRWDDPALGVDWGSSSPILSSRDAAALSLSEIMDRLPLYGQI